MLFFEHKGLYSLTEAREDLELEEGLGKGRVVKSGRDITLISCMKGVGDCLVAATKLAEVNIDAEVIDLRSLRPMDSDLIKSSFSKTKNLLVVEEGPLTGGWAAEVITIASEVRINSSSALWRLTTEDRPIPFSPVLENAFFPSAQVIFNSVRERLNK